LANDLDRWLMTDFPPLTDGETVLWEGRPDTKLRFGIETMATSIFAVAMVLACLGLATVINRSYPDTFWLIFAPGLLVGVFIVMAYPLIDSAVRRKTRYRLTDKHAYIQGHRSGYPIPQLDDLIYRNGTPPTIFFATKGRGRQAKDIGFERITDAKDVFLMLRDRAKELHP
jgi:hypothetical protein